MFDLGFYPENDFSRSYWYEKKNKSAQLLLCDCFALQAVRLKFIGFRDLKYLKDDALINLELCKKGLGLVPSI